MSAQEYYGLPDSLLGYITKIEDTLEDLKDDAKIIENLINELDIAESDINALNIQISELEERLEEKDNL